MLNKFKKKSDSKKIKMFADGLDEMYEEKIKKGCSKHEITVEYMKEVAEQLRKLEKMMEK